MRTNRSYPWRKLVRRSLTTAFLLGLIAAGSDGRAAPSNSSSTPIPADLLAGLQQAKLIAADGGASDSFGYSVSISGDTAIVGVYQADVGGNSNQGAAYVFVRNGTTWTQQAKLLASDGSGGDCFGISVSIDGNTAVIGAHLEDSNVYSDNGAAYVFVRNGTTWTQQAKLLAGDRQSSDHFGHSVSISGDTVLIGASGDDVSGATDQGSAYVFLRAGTTWNQQAKLNASDGGANEYFGWSVSLSGNSALVGAHLDDAMGGTDCGSAYVFTRNGTIWGQQAKLQPNNGAANDWFGISVAISGDTAIVGAYADDVGAQLNQGSAYAFNRVGNVWTQQAQFIASDGSQNESYGYSVAVSGNTAIVGAISHKVGANFSQGAAYVYTRSGTTWSFDTQFSSDDGASSDSFGVSVALSGDTVIAGAYAANIAGKLDQGAAYVFVLRKSNGDACATDTECASGVCAGGFCGKVNGTACANTSECASGFCADGVCCNSLCGNGDTTDCQACSMTAGAMTDGTCAPIAMGTVCRGSVGDCDAAEMCDGASNDCPADTMKEAGSECRAAAGDCDIAETCDGASNDCPADTKIASGLECRAAAGDCDIAETCDGASNDCPADTKIASGLECRAAAGDCDAAESCDGASNDCPADTFVSDGTVCAGGLCMAGVCTNEGGAGGAGGSAGAGGAAGMGGAGGSAGAGGAAGMGGTGGTAGAGGEAGAGGSGGNGNVTTDDASCDCRAAGSSPMNGSGGFVGMIGLGLLALRRRNAKR